MVICLDANYGSRAMVQVPPIGQGLSRSNDTVTPFPNVRPTGHPSMADIKRERLDYSNIRTAASPFPETGNSVSLNASPAPPSSSPEPPISSIGNTELIYSPRWHTACLRQPLASSILQHDTSVIQPPSPLPSTWRARRPIFLAFMYLKLGQNSIFLKQLDRVKKIVAVSTEYHLHEYDMLLIGCIQMVSLMSGLAA
jgi:hypothetical protein